MDITLIDIILFFALTIGIRHYYLKKDDERPD